MNKTLPYAAYESFISNLINGIKKSKSGGRDIRNIGYGKNNTLLGRSGQRHQIDVSFHDYSFDEPKIVFIECKRVARPIEISIIKILKSTIDDIAGHNGVPHNGIGIIISTAPFRRGALRFARYYNLKTEQVAHNLKYSFRYENFIQVGLHDEVKLSDVCIRELIRICCKCGEKFSVKKNENICDQCEKNS